MTVIPAGTEVDYTVTWLEMTARPDYDWPSLPENRPASLMRAEAPPVWYFLSLYGTVGALHEWVDQFDRDPDEVRDWLQDPEMALYTLVANGWPQGFFLLDGRAKEVVDLAYFGLVPEALGLGFGKYLLRTAILTAWDRPGCEKVTVNTCTLDHPRALPTYQKQGFKPVRQDSFSRVLQRDRSEPKS